MQTLAQRKIMFRSRNGPSTWVRCGAHLTRASHGNTLWRGASSLLIATAIAVSSGCASVPVQNSEAQLHTAHQGTSRDYLLTEEEKSLDCATLRGRMQIALLQIKSNAHAPKSSALSSAMQGSLKQIFAGTTKPTDQSLSTAYEISRLRAYNTWLHHHDCQTFDLTRELANMPAKNPANTPADGV